MSVDGTVDIVWVAYSNLPPEITEMVTGIDHTSYAYSIVSLT